MAAFLAADGVEDWVVLHGGATAVYAVGRWSRRPGWRRRWPRCRARGVRTLLTLADGQLTVRLTRACSRLEQQHVELARAVSRAPGREADRAVRRRCLAVAAQPDEIDVGFWRAVLG